MKALEVYRNGQKVCIASAEPGVTSFHITLTKASPGHFHVGGLYSPTQEHLLWAYEDAALGDEFVIRIVEVDQPDPPIERRLREG